MFSRIIFGSQISLSIGLVGVALSLILGIFFGGISGYYGGPVDNLIQRAIEFLKSLPAIPLWLTLSAEQNDFKSKKLLATLDEDLDEEGKARALALVEEWRAERAELGSLN